MKKSELFAKRKELLERIANQRAEVADITSELRRPLALADLGYSVIQQIKRHPYYFIGSALISVLIFRKKINIVKKGFKIFTWLISSKSNLPS